MPVVVKPTEIPDVKLVQLTPYADARGVFVETFDSGVFGDAGLETGFVQDALSRSKAVHTFRGLHFQRPPYAQATLVRVSRGRLLDVVLDLRRTSPTFGRHVARELSADGFAALMIPVGFAHGFCTLEPDTEVSYKLADHYAPDHSAGVNLADPALGIDWPVPPAMGVMSDKDKALPLLADLGPVFE